MQLGGLLTREANNEKENGEGRSEIPRDGSLK